MFTLETAIESYTQGTKAVLTHAQPETVRKNLINLVEKQAEFAKGLSKLSTDYMTFITSSLTAK